MQERKRLGGHQLHVFLQSTTDGHIGFMVPESIASLVTKLIPKPWVSN